MRQVWSAPGLLAWVMLAGLGCGSSGGHSSGAGGSGGTGSGSSGTGGGSTIAPPKGWVQWEATHGGNDHWYGVYRTTGDFQSAQAAAQSFSTKSYLATITMATEQQFLVSTFLTGADQLRVFWIGASSPTHDRVFVWDTGEPFKYTHWKPGEPNNWTGAEYYLCINWTAVRGAIGEWNDVDISGSKGFDSGANDGPYQALVESETTPHDM